MTFTAHPSTTGIELEESILGCILNGITSILEVLPTIPVDAFSISNHRQIFKKMLEIHEQGYIPYLHAVVLAFEKTPKIYESIGGRHKLGQLMDRIIFGDPGQHVRLLIKEYHYRQVAMKRQEMAELAVSDNDINVIIPQMKLGLQEIEEHELAIKGERLIDPDGLRLKLELLALLNETDSCTIATRTAKICSHYRIRQSKIEELLRELESETLQEQIKALGIDELFVSSEPALDYVIPGMLPVGDSIILTGDPKCGKTLLAYNAAFAVATGESDFLGERCKQGRVLIIQTDESKLTMSSRLFKSGFRHEDKENIRWMDNFNIIQLPQLNKILEEFKPTLVVVDNLRNINAGSAISENSAEFADQITYMRKLLSKHGASGIFIHHSNKNSDAIGVQRSRGSSAIPGAVWGMWQLDHIPKPDPNNKKKQIIDPNDPNRILSVQVRDGEGQRLIIELQPGNNHWINHGKEGISEEQQRENKSHEARILEILQPIAPKGLEAEELNYELDLGRSIYSALNRLVNKRIIGTRASTVDKRRTVYYCPTDSNGGSEGTPTPTPDEKIVIEYPESGTVTEVESSITNRSQLITNRSQESVINIDEQALTVDAAGTPEIDHKVDHNHEVSPEISEEVEIPTEKGENNLTEIIENTDTEHRILPKETSVQFQVGDVVRTGENEQGIVDLVYDDGRVGVQVGDRFTAFSANELSAVEPVQQQELKKGDRVKIQTTNLNYYELNGCEASVVTVVKKQGKVYVALDGSDRTPCFWASELIRID